MKNQLKHFAIYVEDVERAKGFYQALFNWEFNDYGPEGFSQIKHRQDEDNAPIGALQSKNYSPLTTKVIGFECSIEVEDIDQTIKAVEGNGGKIVMPKTPIPGVGLLTKFLDPDGNLVCAVKYEKHQFG